MEPVSYASYSTLFKNLMTVCKESGIKYKQKEEDMFNLLCQIPVLNLQEALPQFSVENVALKMKTVTKDLLALYEASERSKLDSLAQQFLCSWLKKVEKKVLSKLGEPKINNNSSKSLGGSEDPENIDSKLQSIFKKLKSSAKYLQKEKAESFLMKKALHPLSKQVVYQVFHQNEFPQTVPEHALKYMSLLHPLEHEAYFIHKFREIQKTISFSDFDKNNVNDEIVALFLKRFPNAKMLDIQDHELLSIKCLSAGHANITHMNLSRTSINSSSVNRKLFPSLVELNQSEVINIVKLSSLLRLKDVALSEAFRNANKIIIDNELSYFIKVSDNLQPILSLIEHADKFDEFPNNNTILLLIDKLFYFWKQSVDPFKVHLFIVEQMKLATKAVDKPVTPKIWIHMALIKKMKEELSLVDIRDKKQVVRNLNQNDVFRLKLMLQSMCTFDLSDFGDTAKALEEQIEVQAAMINSPKREVKGDNDIATYALVNEIFLELSYHLKNDNNITFLGLTCPQAGDRYSKLVDQALACAFAMPVIDSKEREDMFICLLSAFRNFKSETTFYPLQKLILGVIDKRDMPESEHDFPLAIKLLHYRGIFNESISDSTKNDFWNFLGKGMLGGRTKLLVDALVTFYKKEWSTEDQRKKALQAIGQLANYDSADDLSKYANEMEGKLTSNLTN